jgi:L-serine/L-threonine ammonia-lyase
VGGGGLLSGVCEGLKRVGWGSVPVYACQSERCNLLDRAMASGRTPTPTHIYSADGHDLGTRAVAQAALDCSAELDVRSLLVSDSATLAAVGEFLDDERVMVEPLCAVALAALYTRPELFRQHGSVVVVVCGGSLCSLDDVVAWRRRAERGSAATSDDDEPGHGHGER